MEFIATEYGFKDGIGGASNAADKKDRHYVLFGRQTDDQHPEYSGVYFEFDDQMDGSVNAVTRVVVADEVVEFQLKDRRKIIVRRAMDQTQWNGFLSGIHDTFSEIVVDKA